MDSERKLIQHALGIDFGTSNSYFSDVRVGGIQLSYTDLKFHNGQSSVPTCILYKKQNNNGELPQVIDAPSSDAHPALLEHWNPCAFGAAAIELWKDLLDEERPHYHFRGGFKPDIAFTRQSYIDAVNFFRCTRQYLIDQRLITHFTPENGRQVVVGIPAKNIDGQEQKTLQALEDAGIFDAVLIPEPEGALFYHLYYDRNRITIEHAHHGVIVVDFGGGTFDLAYLRDGEVQTNWGNPMLGGRLFDDLFYQWFLEQQEGEKTRRKMISDGTLSFLRTFGFRRLKERFSSAWQNGQIARFRTRITVGVDFDYGVFRNVTIEQFMQRAQSYRPSYDLLLDLELLQDEYAKLLRGESIDLIGQVREQLLQAQEFIQKAAHSPLSAVILTGGSCRWPFMVDITQQIYPQAEIFQSPDPEATISRGLALCFAYREYAKDIGTSLQLDQPSLRRQLLEALSTSYQNFVRRITERFTSELYHGIIKPIFQGWRDKGGSIAHLEHSTRQATQSYFENDGRKAIEREHLLLQENVEKLFHDRIFAWLRQHHITRVEYLSLEYLEEFQHNDFDFNTGLSGIMDDFFNTTKLLLTGLIGVIIASLAGGSGVALLMAGPIGWLIGLVIGAAATISVLSNVDTKNIKIPPLILKRTASDERLLEAQAKFREQLEESLLQLFAKQYPVLETELDQKIAELLVRISANIPVTAVIDDINVRS